MGNNLHNTTDHPPDSQNLPAYTWLEQQEYTAFLKKMQQQAQKISAGHDSEQVWFCEHLPVYTTGKRAVNNTLSSLSAPLVVTDRGGETTYHGSGQLMMYPMIHLKRYHLSVREYVHILEESCIRLLRNYGTSAARDCGLPGVWIRNEKIAALGIRISQGVTSHGIALNVNTDLSWFEKINPCGTSRKATSMQQQGVNKPDIKGLSEEWFGIFTTLLQARLAESSQ